MDDLGGKTSPVVVRQGPCLFDRSKQEYGWIASELVRKPVEVLPESRPKIGIPGKKTSTNHEFYCWVRIFVSFFGKKVKVTLVTFQ